MGMRQYWRTWNEPSFDDQIKNVNQQKSLVPPHFFVLLRCGMVLDKVSYMNWLGHCNYDMQVLAYCYKITKK